MRLFFRWLTFCAVVICAGISPASAKRVALVIGNADYAHAGQLKNPGNDAAAVAKALEDLGFTVRLGRDLTQSQALQLLDTFSRDLRDATSAILYYSGHGMQLGGKNYLLPVDLEPTSERSLRYGAIDVSEVITEMERSADVSIVVLDACRNNPFAEKLRSLLPATRSLSLGRGLAPIKLTGSGAIIAYSAAAGEVASDGAGRHSPYTQALLDEIEAPGVEVGLLFRRVAGHVVKATGGSQRPELLVRLTREFYLKPARATVETATPVAPGAAAGKPAAGDAALGAETAQPAPPLLPPRVADREPKADEQQPAAAAPQPPASEPSQVAATRAFNTSRWGYLAPVKAEPIFQPPAPWTPPASRGLSEQEPNNSLAAANPVGPNDRIALAIHPRYDQDWLRFAIRQPGRLTVTATAPPVEIDLAIRLLDANQKVIGNWQSAPRPGGDLIATVDINSPGAYWLQIVDGRNDAASPTPTEVQLSFTPTKDLFEPNDSIGQARQIPLDGTFALNILPRYDKDWFRLTTLEPGQLEITATSVPEELDVTVRVMNLDGRVVMNWSGPGRAGGDTFATAALARPGTYVIEIRDGGDNTSSIEPFTFTTKFSPSVDPFEPNDSMANAWSVPASSRHELTLFPRYDKDWLRVDVGHPGELKTTATEVPKDLDVTLRVLDGDGKVVHNWIRPGRRGGDTFGIIDLPRPGTYFVELRDSGDDAASIEPFKLELAFTPQADQYEPNNSRATATPIRTGGQIAFNILPRYDNDWFEVRVDEPGELAIEIDEAPGDLDIAFRVLDDNGKVLRNWVRAYRKGGLTEGFSDLPAPGLYYIDVRDAGDDARSIEHAVLKTRFTPTKASLEPNNSLASASRVPLEGTTWAHILPRYDTDWHYFYVPSPGQLSVVIDQVPEELDIAFRALDANAKVLRNWVRGPRKGGVTEGTVHFPAAGWYWLDIRDGGDDARSPQSFRIRRTFTPAK